jgi:hypothetical protein
MMNKLLSMGGMITDKIDGSTRRKSCPSATLCTINPTFDLRFDNPLINCTGQAKVTRKSAVQLLLDEEAVWMEWKHQEMQKVGRTSEVISLITTAVFSYFNSSVIVYHLFSIKPLKLSHMFHAVF